MTVMESADDGPPLPPAGRQCWCQNCEAARLLSLNPDERLWAFRRFITCPACGNKRCPKASHHDHQCSGSNDTGQHGSTWGDWKVGMEPFDDFPARILDPGVSPIPSMYAPKGEATRFIAEGKGEFLLRNQVLHHGLIALMKRNDIHRFRLEHNEIQGAKMLNVEIKEDATGVEYMLKEMGS